MDPSVQKPNCGISRPFLVFLVVLLAGAAYILVPNYLRKRAGEQIMTCRSNLKNIGTAIDMWAKDHPGTYPSQLSELTPDYLVDLPICPAAGKSSYKLSTGAGAPGNQNKIADYYYVECAGENHANAGLGPGRPAYSNETGIIDS